MDDVLWWNPHAGGRQSRHSLTYFDVLVGCEDGEYLTTGRELNGPVRLKATESDDRPSGTPDGLLGLTPDG